MSNGGRALPEVEGIDRDDVGYATWRANISRLTLPPVDMVRST
jgi:hypothetical protein